MRSRSSGVSSGEGLSSITFWWRRWIEHSRSQRCTRLPCASPRTWISTWRGRTMAFSRYTLSSPKAPFASERARARAAGSSAGSVTSRMPLPPPPAAALSITG